MVKKNSTLAALVALFGGATLAAVLLTHDGGDVSLYDACLEQVAQGTTTTPECDKLNDAFPGGWDQLLPCPGNIDDYGNQVDGPKLSFTLKQYYEGFSQLKTDNVDITAVTGMIEKLCLEDAEARFKAQAKRKGSMTMKGDRLSQSVKATDSNIEISYDGGDHFDADKDIEMETADMIKLFNTDEEIGRSVRSLRGGEQVERQLWVGYNYEGICSSSFGMIFDSKDSAECSGKSNGKCPGSDGEENFPYCEAWCDDAEYYKTTKTLGKACLWHDACLQKFEGMCNNGCEECNPGFTGQRSEYPGEYDCDKMMVNDIKKCSSHLWGWGDEDCHGSSPAEARAAVLAMSDFRYPAMTCYWKYKTNWFSGWWVLKCSIVEKIRRSPNYNFCNI